MGKRKGVYRALVGKPEGKSALGSRCDFNIKMNLQEVGFGCMDCIEVAWDKDRWRAHVTAVMNIRVL
jgi:hypothetical protein